ncbi:MAG: hypothetical protein CSA72_00125 [Rhodobacterales bacterium]|nr:MAG: hypothetical protein CR993_07665 [Rhodobacterales bacterium]PIE12565.1 MAG: hypothetical protein CSA72_00125 [Rhodobacterales bacterium]
MKHRLKIVAYYAFLTVLWLLAGLILPLTLCIGAIRLWYGEWLSGAIHVFIAIAGHLLVQHVFNARPRLFKGM